jgi:hypothetical protein
LGRTPVSAMAVKGEDEHRIRIEHEGYHSLETTLGPDSWKRDESGIQFAIGEFSLLSTGEETPEPDESKPGQSAAGTPRPANLQLASTPSSANAWLFVGSTPNVNLGNLDLTGEIQLRIEQGEHPPQFRVLRAGDFDASGKAHLEVQAAPAKEETNKPEAATAPAAATPPATTTPPARKWRPRKDGPIGKAPGKGAKRSSLRGPTPDWAQ